MSFSFTSWTISAILPISVFIPVSVITAFAWPFVIIVPIKTIFSWSVTCVPSLREPIIFVDGTDSPVNDASSTWNAAIWINLASAGTLLPVSNRIISPGTNSLEFISISCPFRITFAFNAVNFLNASIACSALYSWTKPNTPLRTTIIEITIASNLSPINKEITIAAKRITTINEVNCLTNIWSGVIFFPFSISLIPYLSNLCSASFLVKPFSEVFNDCKTSCTFKE